VTRIGLDIRWLHEDLTRPGGAFVGGIGNYVLQVGSRTARRRPDLHFVLFHLEDRSMDDLAATFQGLPNVSFQPLPATLRSVVVDPLVGLPLRYVQEQRVERLVDRFGVDIYHSMSQFDVAYGGGRRRRVVTVHDTIPLSMPGKPRIVRMAWSHHLKRFRRYDAIVADSESTRSDVIRHLRVPPETVVASHLGVGEHFRVLTEKRRGTDVAERYSVEAPYLLYVGGLQASKNVSNLMAALSIMNRATRWKHRLVMVGVHPRLYPKQYRHLQSLIIELGLLDRVVIIPSVADDDLVALYNGADAFVFPTLYEGFGLPVLEAMACGVPVVTTRAASVPEVVGDAAVYVNPEDPMDIARGVGEVLGCPDLAADLRRRGPVRARSFTWDAAADRHGALYDRLLAGG
jgi:glycosyltransferase involved in cell wall biosynthesis